MTAQRAQADDSQQKANQLWEQAVAAKGGRERLLTIQNLVVSSASKYSASPRPDVISKQRLENFYVLPDKFWSWVDYRPGQMGGRVLMCDFKQELCQSLLGGMAAPAKSKSDAQSFDRQRFINDLLIYLMETKEIRPAPIRLHSEWVGFKKYDVVEATVRSLPDQRIEFYLDRESHLPKRIRIVHRLFSGSELKYTITLNDYVDVNGIKMPQSVSWGRGDHNRTSYQMNVDYDEQLFRRTPTIEAGAEAWRRSSNPH